jgi:glycosyltransferase involved in cell wall biosynthesis
MEVSVCITTFNEEDSIGLLLDSLLAQLRKPDEIVIVDGGSKDKTVEIIRHYQKKDRRIRFLVEKGTIAHGRNTAIEISKFPIIAQIDAGCIAKKDWLKKLTQPFVHPEVDMVAGFYEMKANTPLQRVVNVFHGVPPQRYDPVNFLPSARSVAFRKTLWESVGGYSEKFPRAGEDTHFFYKAVKNSARIVRVGDARVIWEESGKMTLEKSLKKFFNYAKGDALSGIWWHPDKQFSSHNIRILLIFFRYIFGLILLIFTLLGDLTPLVILFLFGLYLIYPIWKWRDIIKDLKGRLFLPFVQISTDIMVMAGFIAGLI